MTPFSWWPFARGHGRVTGPPGSANGASSFHVFWEWSASAPLVEVSAVLEVVTPPSVPSLYFWALQVGFADERAPRGAGHTGLQWYPRFPGSTAVNWGGYRAPEDGGGILPGSDSALPTVLGETNTFAFPWVAGRPCRFRVFPSPAGAGGWRAEVTDMQTGASTVIRDLYGGGDRLVSPMVWSEVFADCDAPSAAVRWSGFVAVDRSGALVVPRAVRVNYQSDVDGGCANTTVEPDGDGILQVTSTDRTTPQGTRLLV